MQKINKHAPAFPFEIPAQYEYIENGIPIQLYFAGKILANMIGGEWDTVHFISRAEQALAMANALVKTYNQQKEKEVANEQ